MLDLTIEADLPLTVGDDGWSIGELYHGMKKPATALMRGSDGVWMADHPAEIETQRIGVEEAHKRGGDILVTGLGLCLFARLCLRSDKVRKVVVIEKNAFPINEVGKKWKKVFGDRLEIVHADAFEWLPESGTRFSVGWHDPFLFALHLRSENAAEAEVLMARYAPFCDWQGWWKGDPNLKFYGGAN